jgi:hypothetical protein
MMNILMVADAASTGMQFPVSFTAVYVVGFIAAVSIGSIAWYNSKRPPGWEGKDCISRQRSALNLMLVADDRSLKA